MFKQVTLENFRTHKSTTIELYPVTLLIGNNNSGKTNLLAGIQHFCNLVRRENSDNKKSQTINATRDLYPHKYRLAKDEEPMSFSILWNNIIGGINYKIETYEIDPFSDAFGCKETIIITLANNETPKEVNSVYDQSGFILELRKKIQLDQDLNRIEKRLCELFFLDFDNIFSYHFQPTFLKQKDHQDIDQKQDFEISAIPVYLRDSVIPIYLRETGSNFQSLLHHVKENEQRIFSSFIAKMRTVDTSFIGVRYDPNRSSLIWEFDLGRKGSVEEFMPDVVSDGFMKIAVISLLTSLKKPPALIMLEEIENGINPGNIQQLMNWIWQATSPSQDGFAKTQFILTSHSPSVLREFNQHPDHVYTVRLDKRSRQSDVRNLNTALDTLVGIGAIKDDEVEYETEENTGKQLIKIPKYQLAELWYTGTIG
ncbi:AAA family ATPase [Anabaena sp. AL09]|jgi:AAA15 family ATPase/GTPase|uniref:AAA family ATPase n=1 Tax=Anabaena sp. AL09 TaxID=1710891 RepID=UPI0007FF926D|nr:ATP-binding protein [Anabaena sp. AL09]OBQ13526.1 MAG: chromosome segregation protein SMC [Anabaena sp. AL09]